VLVAQAVLVLVMEMMVLQQLVTETVEAEVEAVEEVQDLMVQKAEAVLQEQSLSIGKINPLDLQYKMYAVIKNGIVEGYSWDNKPVEGSKFILMTFDNSPAYVGGKYINGKFYERE
jgi:hypothetical protein